MDDYNIVNDIDIAYVLMNVRYNKEWGWSCTVRDENNIQLFSSQVDTVLKKAKEQQFPLSIANLNYVLRCTSGVEIEETKPEPIKWIDAITTMLKDLCDTKLKSLKFDRIYRGNDFMLCVCTSKKQAKKLEKHKEWSNEGCNVSRKGDTVVIWEGIPFENKK